VFVPDVYRQRAVIVSGSSCSTGRPRPWGVLASGEVGASRYKNAAETATATSYRLSPKAGYRLEGGYCTKLALGR